ncbi:MAG TPA: tail fiber domain-containing protein [Allosphingosinicella sp.]
MATQSSDYTFVSAQAASIPATVGIVQLQDRDHSFWQRVAAQPSHAGKFRSQDRFLPNGSTDSTNGGWWELMSDQIITPAMFGCSSATADNSAGLTAFYAYLETFECVANHEGMFPVQNSVTMGTATTNLDNFENNCSTIHGRIRLVVGATIAGPVLWNRMKRGTKIEGIEVVPDAATGGASLEYAAKKFDIGLLVDGTAQMQNIDFVTVAYAKHCGVLINGISPANTFGNRFGTGYLYGCGSGLQNDGSPAATDANFLTSAYSAYTREGASVGNDFDMYQYTRISVSALPPQSVTDRGLVVFVRIGNDEYPVADYDRTPGALKVLVWGWVPTSVATSGTVRYIFGGGLHIVGGDGGVQIGSMAITACAIGNHNGALYPGNLDLTLQHNYIGQVIGSSPAGASVGGTTRGYFEGNTADLWYLVSDSRDYSHRILGDQALSLLRVKFHSSKRTPDSAKYRNKPKGLFLSYRNRFHGFVQEPDFQGQFNQHLCTFQVEPRVTALRASAYGTEWIGANQIHITLENWDQYTDGGTTPGDFTRLFGYRSQYYLCTGEGANNAPGAIYIRRNNNTINGAASDLWISDLTGPGFLLIERDPNNPSNVLVNVVAGRSGSLPDNSVTNAKLADMAGNTVKGRLSTTGDPSDLTGTQLTTLLDTFSASLKGLAPASGGGTANFLRADGSWAAPAGVGANPTFTTVTADQFIVPSQGSISGYGGELYVRGGWVRLTNAAATSTHALFTGTTMQLPGLATTASGANAYIDAGTSNSLYRSTSSLRYKTDVRDLDSKYFDKLLELRPVRYRSSAAADDPSLSHFGLIAEEVAEIEPRLVNFTYADEAYEEVAVEAEAGEGEPRKERKLKDGAERKVPDGVQYDRLAVLLLGLVKRQQSDIDSLKAQIAGLASASAPARPRRS